MPSHAPSSQRSVIDRAALLRVLEPVVHAHGAEVVDVEYRPEHGGWVLRVFVEHYNRERPHRSLGLTPPEPEKRRMTSTAAIQRRDRLGGLIHEYYRAAA